jgi:hypothetical protein
LGKHLQFGQAVSAIVFVVGAVTLILVRPALSRAPPSRRISIAHPQGPAFRRFLLPVGAIAIGAAFVWVIAFATAVPDSNAGIAILFGPSITLLIVGVSAIAFRVYVWFFDS